MRSQRPVTTLDDLRVAARGAIPVPLDTARNVDQNLARPTMRPALDRREGYRRFEENGAWDSRPTTFKAGLLASLEEDDERADQGEDALPYIADKFPVSSLAGTGSYKPRKKGYTPALAVITEAGLEDSPSPSPPSPTGSSTSSGTCSTGWTAGTSERSSFVSSGSNTSTAPSSLASTPPASPTTPSAPHLRFTTHVRTPLYPPSSRPGPRSRPPARRQSSRLATLLAALLAPHPRLAAHLPRAVAPPCCRSRRGAKSGRVRESCSVWARDGKGMRVVLRAGRGGWSRGSASGEGDSWLGEEERAGEERTAEERKGGVWVSVEVETVWWSEV